MGKVVGKMQSSPDKIAENIIQYAAGNIAQKYKQKRKLDILGIIYSAKLAVDITDVHKNKSMKPDDIAVKNIKSETEKKSRNKPGFFTVHKAVDSGNKKNKIRYDSACIKLCKYAVLKQKYDESSKNHNYFSYHTLKITRNRYFSYP